MEVCSAIRRVAVEHRRRSRIRRITAGLRRPAMLVNQKCVRRIMRADNPFAAQPRTFVVRTDSHHVLEVHLHLATRTTVKLTGIQRFRQAGTTYVCLRREFVHDNSLKDFRRRSARWTTCGKNQHTRTLSRIYTAPLPDSKDSATCLFRSRFNR
jgi:hypothetical protein